MPVLTNAGNVRQTTEDDQTRLDLAEDAVIVETGSNANGSYVRFSDGTQICWGPTGTVTGLSPTTETVQSLSIYVATLAWTFPAEFAAPPVVGPPNPRLQQGGTARSNHLTSGYASGASATSVNLRLMCLATWDRAENPYPIAIGRWE